MKIQNGRKNEEAEGGGGGDTRKRKREEEEEWKIKESGGGGGWRRRKLTFSIKRKINFKVKNIRFKLIIKKKEFFSLSLFLPLSSILFFPPYLFKIKF